MTADIQWAVTEKKAPPEGVLLDVITETGRQTQLIFEQGMWWLEDKSMYVYFVPLFWKVADTADAASSR